MNLRVKNLLLVRHCYEKASHRLGNSIFSIKSMRKDTQHHQAPGKYKLNHTYPLELLKFKNTTIPSVDKNMEKRERSYIAGGNLTWYNHRKQLGLFSQSYTLTVRHLSKRNENTGPHKDLHMQIHTVLMNNNFQRTRNN